MRTSLIIGGASKPEYPTYALQMIWSSSMATPLPRWLPSRGRWTPSFPSLGSPPMKLKVKFLLLDLLMITGIASFPPLDFMKLLFLLNIWEYRSYLPNYLPQIVIVWWKGLLLESGVGLPSSFLTLVVYNSSNQFSSASSCIGRGYSSSLDPFLIEWINYYEISFGVVGILSCEEQKSLGKTSPAPKKREDLELSRQTFGTRQQWLGTFGT